MMRGGKDEDKVISPMFPRLHVNDTERGGPRAPPRNKMALYEQLSVPSQRQRFSSGSASLFPLPPSSVPSTSASTHGGGGGRERSPFTSFSNSPAPSHSTEKLHSYSSNGMKASHGSTKPTDYQKSLSVVRPLQQPIAKGHSFQPPNFPNFRNSSFRKHGSEDVVAVPTFSRSGIVSHCTTNTQQRKDREQQFPLFCTSSSMQLKSSEKHVKGTGIVDPSSRQHVKNPSGESGDRPKASVSIPSTGEKILVDSSPTLLAKDRSSGSLKRARESSDQIRRSLLEAVSKRRGTDAHLFQESLRENALKVMSEKCLRPSAEENGNGNDGHNRLASDSERQEGKDCGSVQVGEAEKDNDVSDSSMVDSVSVLDISPDDVVGVMGEKHFWKARRAIVNQQRVFGVQVFELHRLIKVQRLIAESPHLLLEDTLSLIKPCSKGSLAKKLSSESVLEPSPAIVKPRNGSQNPNAETEGGAESVLPKLPLPLPLPLVSDETSKGHAGSYRSFYGPYSGNQPPPSLPSNAKPSPWCFHPPPGNQWLVPVMSPSEGFVYKPYTGPGPPPSAGLMTPVYGSYDPMNTGYGVLASPLGQAYFPPYGMPGVNPSASGSAVEQVSPFAKAQAKGRENEDQLSNVDINFVIPRENSCNMSSQMSRAVPCRVRKQGLKESELQGSTASSPSLRVNGEAQAQALPLFPMESDLNAQPSPRASEQPARVIKVVPHNPRSATESAARIFQFIQEERKQFD